MKMYLIIITWLVLASAVPAEPARPGGDARAREAVGYLASPELKGRLTGSDGESSSAEYIVKRLKNAGVKPLPGNDSLVVPFQFTAASRDGGTSISIPGRDFTSNGEVQALSFSDSVVASGPLVFAGYGIKTGEDAAFKYDSFDGLDLKDKVVLILRYYPENVSETSRTVFTQRISELRTKAQNIRERGAKAILVTAGPRYPAGSDIVPMTYDSAIAGSGIAAASIGTTVAAELLRAAGRTPEEFDEAQKRLDTGDVTGGRLELSTVTVTLAANVTRQHKAAHNILGYLPSTDPASTLTAEYIAIGAHYDHLGDGKQVGNSLARSAEQGRPHVGADDNASGVAAVLDLADALATETLKRPILIGLWTGEEIGVLGSNDFIRNGVVKPASIAAYFNFDMVGRSKDNKLTVLGVGSSTLWPRIVEQANATEGFTISSVKDPYVPSDASPFYIAGVPILNFFTGSHEDYHRPSDTADKINYKDLDRIVRVGERAVKQTANLDAKPDYVKVERTVGSKGGGARASLRAYIGGIPDFSAEVAGLKLGGVINGAPADKAGLKEGDIVVEVAGRKITNIYDYTNVLATLKAGVPAPFVVTRDGQRVALTVTPGTRN